jgi:methylenetetrahydrofolate reductase (NADPH)
VTNLAQIKRIAALCGAKLPPEFLTALEACGDDAAAQFEVGVSFATRQVQDLLDRGAPGIHFYVLNKSQATARILQSVQIAPPPSLPAITSTRSP